MKSILLTKSSSPQIYLANQLFKKKIIDYVYLEDGFSIDTGNYFNKQNLNFRNIFQNLNFIFLNILKPRNLYYYFFKLINKNKFFGFKNNFDNLILKYDYKKFNPNINIKTINNINDVNIIKEIIKSRPRCIFVFGTSILSSELISKVDCPMINLHWGISPKYRGEGIISSLAIEGKSGPGVTIHKISSIVDSGDILYQGKPKIIKDDNFYSIGLKLTKIGLLLLIKVHSNMQKEIPLLSNKNISETSFFFNSNYMKRNPKIYYNAWRELKK